MKSRLVAVSLAFVLCGCAVGPDYRKPDPDAPGHWQTATDNPEAGLEALNSAVSGAWWKIFADPVLDRLMEQALANNLDIKLALTRIEEARATRKASRAAFFPSVDGSAGVSRTDNPFPGLVQGLRFDLFELGFDVAWELDLFGRLKRREQAASAGLGEAVEQHRAVLVTLAAEVARHYVELRGVQHQLSITHANLEARRHTLDLTRKQFFAGTGTRHDVVRAKAQLEAARAEVPLLESRIVAAQRQLEVLSGLRPGTLRAELVLPTPVPVAQHRAVFATPAAAIRHRPDIRAAERELAAANALHGAAVAELYPKVSLSALLGLKSIDAATFFNAASKSWNTGISLLTPILNFGRIRARIDMAKARERQAYIRYEQKVLEALKETEVALTRYIKEEVRREALAGSVAGLDEAVKISRLRYREGIASFLEVLDAERDFYRAEIELARSQTDVATGLIAVYKALGGGPDGIEGGSPVPDDRPGETSENREIQEIHGSIPNPE
ncbi:MAG: efflux transporter outer membrane subunit [Pseudomonadota bacterium]